MPALITSAIRNRQVAIDTAIMSGRRTVKQNWEAVAIKKSQGTAIGLYAWMNDIPTIARKQANGYQKSGVSTQSFTLTSEEFGHFLEIKKQEFRDNNMDNLIDIAARFGARIEEFPQDLIYSLFKEGDQTTYNGRSSVAFDGLAFFSDSHYTNGRNSAGGTYDNNLTSTALSAANIAVAEAALANIPDNTGKPLNQALTDIVVPPQLAQTAADIFLARTISTGGENMNSAEGRRARGLQPVTIHSVPEIGGDATTWYAISKTNGRAPMILQETEPLIVIPLLEETMEHVLRDNVYMWAVKGEYQAGWGDPRTAIRCIA